MKRQGILTIISLKMASATAREFETIKGRKFQVRKFYDQFKTCLPKIAMIVQGVLGNSNEDTFDQGQVVVIVSRTHKTLNPRRQLEGGSEYVEAHFITEEDIVGESISLPMDLPDLLIAEVTGIKGLNKEQWKDYQIDIRSQLTSATNLEAEPQQTDETDVGDEYETCNSTIRSRTEDKKKSKFPFRTMKKQFERFKNALTAEQPNMETTSDDTKSTPDDDKPTTKSPDVKIKEPIYNRRNSPPPIAPKPTRKPNTVDAQETKGRNIPTAKNHYENDIPRQNVPPILKKPTQKVHNQGNEYETPQSISDYQNRNTYDDDTIYENNMPDIDKTKQSTTEPMNYPLDVEDYENQSFEMHSENVYGNVKVHQQRKLRSTISGDTTKQQYVTVCAVEAAMPVVQENKYPRLPAIRETGNKLTSEMVKQLTIEDVSDKLKLLNLHKYVDSFSENQIDGELLSSLDEDILTEEFKMTKFEAIKLRNFAKEGRVPASRNQSLS